MGSGQARRPIPQSSEISKVYMRSHKTQAQGFAICISNVGYPASLEVQKLYPKVDDPLAHANDLIRVIDESGEDYVYPNSNFLKAVPTAQ